MKKIAAMSMFLFATTLVSCGAGSQSAANQDSSERIIEIDSEGWKLAGTLRLPDTVSGPAPVVLLLHQFNNDRSVYANLAALLAERGIASLRLDLRGHGESTNKGGIDRVQLLGTWPDVVAALKFLEQLDGVDAERIGSLSASYSGEALAHAGREYKYPKANVVLSSGTMTAESISALKDSGDVAWWFLAARDDPSSAANMESAHIAAPVSTFDNFEAGGHGANLFRSHPDLEEQIADWFVEHLKN